MSEIRVNKFPVKYKGKNFLVDIEQEEREYDYGYYDSKFLCVRVYERRIGLWGLLLKWKKLYERHYGYNEHYDRLKYIAMDSVQRYVEIEESRIMAEEIHRERVEKGVKEFKDWNGEVGGLNNEQ